MNFKVDKKSFCLIKQKIANFTSETWWLVGRLAIKMTKTGIKKTPIFFQGTQQFRIPIASG